MNDLNPDVIIDVPMTVEQQLDYTQRMRLKIAQHLAPNESVVEDAKDRRELASTLAAIDQQVFARKQADIDSKTASSGERIANFLSELQSIGDVSKLHRSNTPVIRDVSPDLSFIEDDEITEHMISQEANSGDTNYTDFAKEFKQAHPEYDD